MLERKIYTCNNDDISFVSVFQRLPSPIENRVSWAATHYYTWAWQTLIHGKECFILLINPDHKRLAYTITNSRLLATNLNNLQSTTLFVNAFYIVRQLHRRFGLPAIRYADDLTISDLYR